MIMLKNKNKKLQHLVRTEWIRLSFQMRTDPIEHMYLNARDKDTDTLNSQYNIS